MPYSALQHQPAGHFETFTTVTAAIAREKQLKGWLRIRKLNLIISTNPDWRDLSEDWGHPIKPRSEVAFEAGQEISENEYRGPSPST
jgi:hypothetical protein